MDIVYNIPKLIPVKDKIEVFETIDYCHRKIIDGDIIFDDILPPGFQTDGASIPRPFWAIYPPWGIYRIPAIWHDWDYRFHTRQISRYNADKYFNKGMKMIDNLSRFDRRLIYLAVRFFGGDAWEKSFTKNLKLEAGE